MYKDKNGKYVEKLFKNPIGKTTIIGGEYDDMEAYIIAGPQVGTGYYACHVPYDEEEQGYAHVVITSDGRHALPK